MPFLDLVNKSQAANSAAQVSYHLRNSSPQIERAVKSFCSGGDSDRF